MFNPREIIHVDEKAFRLFEAVFQNGFEPCSNGSENLYATKIRNAKIRDNEGSARQWEQARHIERRSFENPGLIIQIGQQRFHARYEADGWSRTIKRQMINDDAPPP